MVDRPIVRGHEAQAPEIPQCWFLEPGITQHTGDDQEGWKSYLEELGDNQQLFREQSDEYFRNIRTALGLDPRMRVLDFGCGFGHVAERLAPHVGELSLWDASANMRRHAHVNLAKSSNIRFLDLSAPDFLGPEQKFDMILVNSVIQYMTPEQFSAWLLHWRNMLAQNGRIVISDIIPPGHPALRDVWDLLQFSARRGFLLRAMWQALGEIWQYWGVRRVRPLTQFRREDFNGQAVALGMTVKYLPLNLTHFTKRLTAVFTCGDAWK